MSSAAHSTWAPSSFARRVACPGSYVLEAGAPDRSSEDAARGTAAHQVLTWAVQQGKPAAAFLNERITVEDWTFTVNPDMAERVQTLIDWLSTSVETVLGVDCTVNFAPYLNVEEAEAYGTLDVCGAQGSTLVVVDYKDGFVPVSIGTVNDPNEQVALYALGALDMFEAAGPWENVLLGIAQPRESSEPSTITMTVAALREWAERVANPAVKQCLKAEDAAQDTQGAEILMYLVPGEDQCRFCKAKASCPALSSVATSTVFDVVPATPEEFTEASAPVLELGGLKPEWLGAYMGKLEMIEDWCKAIRAEGERRLLAGQQVPGFKLVQGRKGPRSWQDPKAAEEMLTKTFRLPKKIAFELTLISPTTAEKLAKAKVIGAEQWAKLQEQVAQSGGKYHVAPNSAKGTPVLIGSASGDFEPVADPNQFA